MRKIVSFVLIVFVVCLFNIPSFAGATDDSTGSITLGGDATVNLSANVHAKYASDNGDAYSASTFNEKGTQTYLTGSWTTYIYYKDGKGFPTTFNGNSGDEPSSSDATWHIIGKE